MHELFITATVPADGTVIQESLAIIQAYTNMCPVQILKRKVNFKGPKGPQDGGPPLPAFAKEAMRPRNASDAERMKLEGLTQLNQRITKNSYYMTMTWREDQEGSSSDANPRPGTLRFVEKPDVFVSPIVSRAFIEVQDDYLPQILGTAGYSKIAESFVELYHSFHNGITFELMRILTETCKPSQSNYQAYGNAWILTVKVEVMDVNKPEQVNHATKLLQKVCADWQGYFVFDHIDPANLDPKARWIE